MFVLTEITTFCGRSLRLLTTVNFEPLVDHGFINQLVIIIAPLTVRFGSCRLFRASGELRIAIINHGLKRCPVVNCGSVTGGDVPPIIDSKHKAKLN